MDIATIVGILVGLGCIAVGVLADGGNFKLFVQIPAILIVVGGTIASTCIHFTLGQVFKIMSIIKKLLFYPLPPEQDLIQKMVNYAAISRRDGPLALQKQLPTAKEPFLIKAMQMVIDGQKPEAIHKQLSMEVQYLQERHAVGKKMMEFMGAGCPAFGMVGTLIGLVQMFANMEDPSKIGAGLSTALVCTFYGAFLANLFFIPMAGKLGIRSKKEALMYEMILEGVIGIAHGESPTAVRESMQTFVSSGQREDFKPKISNAA